MTSGPIEFGAVTDDAARVAEVDFSDVVLDRHGLPAEASPDGTVAHQPPPVPAPADQRPTPFGVHAGSDLDNLVAEMKRDLGLEDVVLPVPLRAGFQARYRLVLDDHELQPWRRESYDPTCLEGVDQGKLARLGLAALNTGILADGRDVLDEAGNVVTFASPWLLDQMGVKTPPEALRKFYALDAHVTSSWSSVMARSGFGTVVFPVDELAEPDPEPPDPR